MSRNLPVVMGILSILSAPVVLADDKTAPPVEQGEVSEFDYEHNQRSRAEVAAEGRDAMRSGAFNDGDVTAWEYAPRLGATARAEAGASTEDASGAAASSAEEK